MNYRLLALVSALLAPAIVFAEKGDKDLPNFHSVAPGIWRGAAPSAEGLRKLKARGIRTIIDLRIEKKGQKEEEATAKALGLTRLRIPMGSEAPTRKQVQLFFATLEGAGSAPVFVHCQHGADRTGAMIGLWRVTHQGWDFETTWKEMRKYGFKPWYKDLKACVRKSAKK
jgi:protein tyrosine/serine phosphatase